MFFPTGGFGLQSGLPRVPVHRGCAWIHISRHTETSGQLCRQHSALWNQPAGYQGVNVRRQGRYFVKGNAYTHRTSSNLIIRFVDHHKNHFCCLFPGVDGHVWPGGGHRLDVSVHRGAVVLRGAHVRRPGEAWNRRGEAVPARARPHHQSVPPSLPVQPQNLHASGEEVSQS